MSLSNPFFFEGPSNRWEFTDRKKETKALQQHISQAGRRILIFGRRRMGKTSILEEVGHQSKGPFILVDVSKAASMAELAKKILAEVPTPTGSGLEKALKLAQHYLKEVALRAGKLVLSAEFRPMSDASTLEGVLNLINDYADDSDSPWTVALDEFQDIRLLGEDRIDWKLRGVMQKHRNVNYVFTGSDHRLTEWMSDPKAAFFKQLQMLEIGPIDPHHLIAWLKERAKRGGMASFPYAEEIVALAGPCTGDIVRLAKTVFDMANTEASAGVVATAFDVISLRELNSAFASLWRSITAPSGRSVLRAIAAGDPATGADTLRKYGIRSSSTAGTAVTAMIERQFLVRGVKGTVAFDNPFFRRWVRYNGEESQSD